MTTAAPSFEDLTRQLAAADPANALEVAIKATELARAETERAKEESRELASVEIGENGFVAKTLGGLYQAGRMYARSGMVKKEFRNKVDDCAIIVEYAQRLKISAFMLFQHAYIVHGNISFASQLAIALLQDSGKTHGPIHYEFTGEPSSPDYGCTASVKDAETGTMLSGLKVDWRLVTAEGWDKPKGEKRIVSKWITMPDLMFRYRSALWMIRTMFPGVLMGMRTVDELEDIGADESKPVANSLADLTDELKSKAKAADPPPEDPAPEPTVEPPPEPEPAPEVDRQEESTLMSKDFVGRVEKAKTVKPGIMNLERWAEEYKGDGRLHPKDYETVMAACLKRRQELAAAEGANA